MFEPGAWYAAFVDREREHWWDFINPRGFRHVLVFGYGAAADAWVVHSCGSTRTEVSVLSPDDFNAFIVGLVNGQNAPVLRLELGAGEGMGVRLGFWCTSAAAHVMGVRSSALRPIGLYRDLLARGALPAFEGLRDAEAEGTEGRPEREGGA